MSNRCRPNRLCDLQVRVSSLHSPDHGPAGRLQERGRPRHCAIVSAVSVCVVHSAVELTLHAGLNQGGIETGRPAAVQVLGRVAGPDHGRVAVISVGRTLLPAEAVPPRWRAETASPLIPELYSFVAEWLDRDDTSWTQMLDPRRPKAARRCHCSGRRSAPRRDGTACRGRSATARRAGRRHRVGGPIQRHQPGPDSSPHAGPAIPPHAFPSSPGAAAWTLPSPAPLVVVPQCGLWSWGLAN